jgi:FkbM family methyltransferase
MSSLTSSFKTQIRRFLPKSIKSHTILSGPLRRERICTSWHDYPGAILGTTEKPLLEWFHRHVSPGETWLDIGAHYGYTALCRLVGPNGRVVAFEPVLSTAGCIAQTRQLNRLRQLQIVPVGLSCCSDVETRYLPVIRGMADCTIPHNVWEERITVVSFDVIWKLLCDASPEVHGVKIDVQGMELEVLAGMRHMLRRYKPKVIVEFHTGVDRRSVLDLLCRCGYRKSGEPVEPQATGPGAYSDDKSYAFLPETDAVSEPR